MLQLSPIIKSLWRNKMGPSLIILQMALTITIVSNAFSLIAQRLEIIHRPTGMVNEELFRIWVKQVDQNANFEDIIKQDMELIRSIPGIIDAVPTTYPPHAGYGDNTGFTTKANSDTFTETNPLSMTDHGINTLGLTLLKGRNFNENEIEYVNGNRTPSDVTKVMITLKLANALFPDGNALNKTIYAAGEYPCRIIGIIETMIGTQPHSRGAGNVVFLPRVQLVGANNYIIRSQTQDRDRLLNEVVEKLKKSDNRRLAADEKTMMKLINDTYASDLAMVKILSTVVFMLVFINSLGIIGLSTFRINQRRKQIGIRRALGASKSAIAQYFITENALIFLLSAVIGSVLALAMSDFMVRSFQLDLLHWHYIAITNIAMLLLTLASVLTPSWRAAQISPAVATASV